MPDEARGAASVRYGPVLAHAGMLVGADLAGVAFGAVAARRILGADNEVWLQLPIAVVATVALYWLGRVGLGVLRRANLRLRSPGEHGAGLAASLALGVVLLVPAHYLATGYLTGLGNLVALAIYQLPVNTVALFLPAALARWPADGG